MAPPRVSPERWAPPSHPSRRWRQTRLGVPPLGEVFQIEGVGTSIIGRPRPLPRQRLARPLTYTLDWEDPLYLVTCQVIWIRFGPSRVSKAISAQSNSYSIPPLSGARVFNKGVVI